MCLMLCLQKILLGFSDRMHFKNQAQSLACTHARIKLSHLTLLIGSPIYLHRGVIEMPEMALTVSTLGWLDYFHKFGLFQV